MNKETVDFISVRERQVSVLHDDTVRDEGDRADKP